MKKLFIKILVIASFAIMITSCKTIQAPKFTSIDRIMDLKMGMSSVDVFEKLGSPPYDVLFCQAEGYTLYLYYYKVIERKVIMLNLNKIGNEAKGDNVYNAALKSVWLLFDKNNKLESYITSNGKKDAVNHILINNTVYTMSLDKGKYILLPDSFDTIKTEIIIPAKKKKK